MIFSPYRCFLLHFFKKIMQFSEFWPSLNLSLIVSIHEKQETICFKTWWHNCHNTNLKVNKIQVFYQSLKIDIFPPKILKSDLFPPKIHVCFGKILYRCHKFNREILIFLLCNGVRIFRKKWVFSKLKHKSISHHFPGFFCCLFLVVRML